MANDYKLEDYIKDVKSLFLYKEKDGDDPTTRHAKKMKHHLALFFTLYGCSNLCWTLTTLFVGTWWQYDYTYFLSFALAEYLAFLLIHAIGLCLLWQCSKQLEDRERFLADARKEYCLHFIYKYGLCLIVGAIFIQLIGNNRLYTFLYIYGFLLAPEILVVIWYRLEKGIAQDNVEQQWSYERTSSSRPTAGSMALFWGRHIVSAFFAFGVIILYNWIQGIELRSEYALAAISVTILSLMSVIFFVICWAGYHSYHRDFVEEAHYEIQNSTAADFLQSNRS